MIQQRDSRTPQTSGPAARPAQEAEGDGATIPVVRLEWLVPDRRGEIVLYDDSHAGTLLLESRRPVLERGRVRHHRTLGGDDVSGWNFLRFADGPTLYYPPGVTLTLVEPEGDRRP